MIKPIFDYAAKSFSECMRVILVGPRAAIA